MRATSPSSILLSLTIHVFLVVALFLTTYFVARQAKEQPVIFELVAGIFVLVGFQTRIAAYLLAAFSVFTALVFHSGTIAIEGFPDGANGLLTVFNGLMMWKNITIAGGFLVLAAFGPGAYSIDARSAAGKTVTA